jgi:N-acetylglutamate synthase-like GNAT family acetyltransferase
MNAAKEIRVRRAAEGDLARLTEMVNEAYRMEEEFLEGQRIDLERMRAQFETGTMFVAEESATGRVVACVYAEVLRERVGYMGTLAVDPAMQGSGLARRMMDVAEGYLRQQGCTQVEISVLSLRPELMPIYNHLGFAQTGTGKYGFHRKLKPGVECETILMAKKL